MSIALLIAFVIIFLVIKWLKPGFLQFKKDINKKPEGLLDIDDHYNISKVDSEKELNTLLDKIHQKGIDKLSAEEKKRLEQLSK